ncbi:MAG: YgjP-like metallopeptidase domain-containing protein [Owenweeksia sp.]|nr:YgjP-like metallopeptidase domain-containing protein [Owenweeksia sp.]
MIVSGIDIDIKRSKRKTVSIFVERDGRVSARVPADLSDDQIAEVIEGKSYKIHSHLAEWSQLNEASQSGNM